MNDLTMGPLPAKVKRETVSNFSALAVRCGVRDCPEKFGFFESLESGKSGAWLFEPGYIQSNGVWIKTRRPQTRMPYPKKVFGKFAEEEIENRNLEVEKQMGIVSAWHNAFHGHEAGKIARALKQLKTHNVPSQKPDDIEWPIIVKCARCGRLSKIERAD